MAFEGNKRFVIERLRADVQGLDLPRQPLEEATSVAE